MDPDDDALGGTFGLSRVLASSGVDPAAFSSFFSKTGGQSSKPSTSALDEIDAESDDEAKYEDDISDSELPTETAEEVKAKEARKAEEERWYRRAVVMQQAAESSKAQEERERKRKSKEKSETERVKRVWPEFEQGKMLKMSEIFYATPQQRKAWAAEVGRKKRRRQEVIEYPFRVEPRSGLPPQSVFLDPALEDIRIPDTHRPRYETPLGAYFDPEWIKASRKKRWKEMTKPPDGLYLNGGDDYEEFRHLTPEANGEAHGQSNLDLIHWEHDIVLSSLDQDNDLNAKHQDRDDPLAARNDILDSGDWLQNIIWDARRLSPGLLEDEEEALEHQKAIAASVARQQAQSTTASKLDPFNISNDHLYEHTREARFRIRQTFGAIEVFHSGPAKSLQIPFYKTSLSKAEARAWHRPALQFPTGISLSFSKLKSNPSAAASSKKKSMMADPSERFKSTKDLSMSEKGPYVLMEFSEEYPPIMSGFGMGTTIVNYYRKKDDKDEHVPKLDFGQPSILNVGDGEPFLLAYVDRGKVTQVIHNNLIRAPVFRHQPETTDFLVVRQTVNGHASYYLRAINNLYTVGQTVPNESEVPGPHARKNTNTAKQRLMIVAWLLMQKSKAKRLKISKLLKYFPDQSELQLRQRLKIKGNEFLIYVKDGQNPGYWTMNPEYDFPATRKEVLERCQPEHAVLYEAMQVGARHLHDAGYSKTAEGKEDDEFGDESGLDIEQQLAVWSTTNNYRKAEAQKAWLLLHGEGDPTGRGEGFSFLTTNMKGYFLRRGETEEGRRLEEQEKAGSGQVKISNAAQQQIYEEEKRKVWDLQAAALSNPVPPELTHDEEMDRPAATPAGMQPRFGRSDSRRAFSRGHSMTHTPFESPGSPSAFSADADGESAYTGNVGAGKVMRIQRVVKGKTVTEIVRDPAVIRSYMKRLEEKKLEYYMDHPEELAPSGDTEEDAIKKEALRLNLEKYKKNQQRRLARKKSLKGELTVYEEGDDAAKRRCGACGQLGHTRANRACPKFNAGNATGPSPASTTPNGGLTTPGASGGIYGMGYGAGAHEATNMPPPAAERSTSFRIRLGTGNQQ